MGPNEREDAERRNQEVREKRERYLFRPARRFASCFERYNGAVTAAATVAIACLTISLSLDSNRQAETARQQFTIMQGQLDEMKVQSSITRNQVRAYLTFSYGKNAQRDGIFVVPTFRNTGGSEALNFKGWDDKQLFSPPIPDDFDFIKLRAKRTLPSRSIGRSDQMLLPNILITFDEMRKIAARQSQIIVWGYAQFADVFKTEHHNHFCFYVTVNPEGSELSLALFKDECNSSD
jgi:hypothetical protein